MSSIPSTDAFFLFYTVDVVPIFFGSWVHGLASSTAQRTLGPRLSISGTGYICSVWPRLAGPVVVGQFGPGFCDNTHG